MALIWVDDGELAVLSLVSGTWGFGIGLYKDGELTPAEDTTFADCAAAECDFSGYGRRALTWLTPTLVAGVASVQAEDETWQQSGGPTGNDVGGYFVYRQSDDTLLYVEALDTAKEMNVLTDFLTIRPRIECD